MVVAPSMVDAVRACGGWLFDRVMAGWDVMALVAEPCDTRPLQILGVRTVEMEAAFTSPVPGPWPHAVAVDARLYSRDARVRRLVRKSLDQGLTEVRLWGDRLPVELDGEPCPVCHRLSVAARAFKAQALAAADVPAGSIGESEVFRGGELLPGTPDLVSA